MLNRRWGSPILWQQHWGKQVSNQLQACYEPPTSSTSRGLHASLWFPDSSIGTSDERGPVHPHEYDHHPCSCCSGWYCGVPPCWEHVRVHLDGKDTVPWLVSDTALRYFCTSYLALCRWLLLRRSSQKKSYLQQIREVICDGQAWFTPLDHKSNCSCCYFQELLMFVQSGNRISEQETALIMTNTTLQK